MKKQIRGFSGESLGSVRSARQGGTLHTLRLPLSGNAPIGALSRVGCVWAPGHLECVQGGTRHEPGYGWDVWGGGGRRQAGKADGAAPTRPGRAEAQGAERTGSPPPTPLYPNPRGREPIPPAARGCALPFLERPLRPGGMPSSTAGADSHACPSGDTKLSLEHPPWAGSGQPPVLAPAFTWALLHLPTCHPWLSPSPTSQAIWTNSFSFCLSFLTWTIRL